MSNHVTAPDDLIRPCLDITPTEREAISWDQGCLSMIGRVAAALRRVGNSREVVEDFFVGAMEVGPDESRAFLMDWIEVDMSVLTGDTSPKIVAVSEEAEKDAVSLEKHFARLNKLAPGLRVWFKAGDAIGLDLEAMMFFAQSQGVSLPHFADDPYSDADGRVS